jgi:uncharacterized protein YndB with AHSA1/START domain
MFIVDRSLDFEHPVARVWEVFTDLENWGEWSEHQGWFKTTRMSFAPEEGSLRGPGMKIVANKKDGFAHKLIVQEWEKPQRVRFVTFDPGVVPSFKLDMTWSFTPKSATSTHLDYHLEFDFAALDIFDWFIQRGAEKKIDQIFERSRKFL